MSKCYGNLKGTTADFKEKVADLTGDEYMVLGEYVNSSTDILMFHKVCGNDWLVRPNNFVNGSRCFHCNGTIQRTQEQFEKEVFDLVGGAYSVIGEYSSANEKVMMRHNDGCGFEYPVSPIKFLKARRRCPKCAGKTRDTKQFKEEIFDLYSDEYELVGEVTKSTELVKIKHVPCNFEYEVTPTYFLSGKKCPQCFTSFKKTTEEFANEVNVLTNGEYTLLSEYDGKEVKVDIRHEICGNIYPVTPSNFLNGSRCPRCHESRGEKAINEFLKKHEKYNISFIPQFTFEDCKYKKLLPFDFAVFKDDILLFVIEYQGLQHYEPISYFGGESGFKDTKKRDKIKKYYCYKNGIKLVEIPYWAFDNIEMILSNEFNLG